MTKRFLVVFLLSIASTVLAANPKPVQPSISPAQRQAELKAAYEMARAAHPYAVNFSQPHAMSPASMKAQTTCQSFGCAVDTKAQIYERLISAQAKRLATSAQMMFSNVTHKVSRTLNTASYWAKKNILRDPKILTNLPPVIGQVNPHTITSGSRPVVQLSLNSIMTDPDGTIDHVVWDFNDGTTMTIPASEVDSFATVFHTYPLPNHYEPSISVCDDLGACTSAWNYCEVANNLLPIPQFTVDNVSGSAPLTVNFSSGTTDPENDLGGLGWNYGDGSSDFGGTEMATASHTYSSNGTYTVTHFAFDNELGMATTTATIYVGVSVPSGGMPPSVVMNSTDLIGHFPLTVQFDASSSFILGGGATIASYDWDFGDFDYPDNFYTGSTVTHEYHRPGTYFGHLAVASSAGAISDYYFSVYVEADSVQAPQIIALQDDSTRHVNFDLAPMVATALPYQVFWDFGDSSQTTGSGPDHTYSSNGTYTVTLTELDIHGIRQTTTKSITVGSSNDSPNINGFYLDSNTLAPNVSTTFHPDGASDPEGHTLTYAWDFGDGATSASSSPTHSYSQSGLYVARLVLTNSRGISSVRTQAVTVIDGSNPITSFIYSPKIGNAPLSVHFDASGSGSDNATVVSYRWVLPDNTEVMGATFDHTFTDPGDYFVHLFVTDSSGNTAIDTRGVHVVDGGSIPGGQIKTKTTDRVASDCAR